MENEILQQILNELKDMRGDITDLKQGQAKLEADVRFVKDRVIVMEQDHKQMLDALLDADSVHEDELSDIRLRLLRLEQTS